jgi:uncharacterized lipoprotein YmbA
MREARKVFFSEEKKQKTFILRPWPGCIRAMAGEQKFFGSFFQKRTAFFLILALTLAGCASPDPNFYTLNATSGATLTGAPASIEVRRPGLAGYLDRADIVLKNDSYTLSVNSQQRWGEPLGDMIGRVMAEDLTQRLPGSSVFDQSGAITANPDARVEIDILKFDPAGDGTVVLNAEYAIEAGTTHHPIAARHVSLSATPSGPGAAALAAAESGLLGTLADQIASDAVSHLPPS